MKNQDISITLEQEIHTLKDGFLKDLRVRGIPKSGSTCLTIFHDETLNRLTNFGFKINKTREDGNFYEISYPKKSVDEIRNFFKSQF